MADTNSAKPGLCFIAYGWSEGPWQGKKMRAALARHGFTITDNVAEADIIVAHSMGCYLIPKTTRCKLVMMIGLPYWPGRPVPLSVILNTMENIKSSWRDGSPWWLNKLIYNCWYIISRPSATYHAMTRRHLSQLPKANADRKIILVRNAGDMFCHPEINELLPNELGYEYVDMDEELHEDCWLNPEPYVKLIGKYHG